MLLVGAVTAVAQTGSTPAQPTTQGAAAAPQQGAAPAPAQQKKEIKDPAEYNAYMGALGQQDPAAKISGLEAFLTQYPNSVMKEDALELLMGSYQQTGNAAKMQDTAQKVLQANPCNLRALALLAYTKQAMAQQGGAAATQNLTDAGQFADKGLSCESTATKPEGTSQADFDKLKTQTAVIFNGASGIAAYQTKDFAKAQEKLRAAVDADPTNLVDVYTLARAYFEPGPTGRDLEGLFYIARSANLAQGAGKDQIAKYGKSKYTKYHGSDEGWNDLMAKAATATNPSGITITQYVPPTPAQQAHDLMESKKVQEMSFAEWQLVLSDGAPEDADKVWTTLKGKPLQMVGHVMSIDSTGKLTKLMLAGSADDIDAKRADVDLTMAAALPKKDIPKEDRTCSLKALPSPTCRSRSS